MSRIGGMATIGKANVVGGKTYTPMASYPSSSGAKTYTVCEVSDGTTSCDCMGWTRRNPPGGRTCKHTQDYDQWLRGSVPGRILDKMAQAQPQPVEKARDRERGGTLEALFKKLDKGGI